MRSRSSGPCSDSADRRHPSGNQVAPSAALRFGASSNIRVDRSTKWLLSCSVVRTIALLEQALRQAGKKDARLSISACTASYISKGAVSDPGVQHRGAEGVEEDGGLVRLPRTEPVATE
jgi:hypothetical protein